MVGTLYRPLLLGAVISMAFTAGCADASPPPKFKCEQSKHPQLQREGYRLGEFIYDMGDGVGLTGYPSGPGEKLPKLKGGPGQIYGDKTVAFLDVGKRSFLLIADGTMIPCQPAAGGGPGGAR